MNRHKFLEELDNYKPLNTDVTDGRYSEWVEQRKIYGFDETDTWSLDTAFYAWLYEHLRMYVEKASEIVNLEYHKFEYRGAELTQLQIINMILDRIRYYFSDEYDDWSEVDAPYIQEIGKLWAMILPAMWW